MQRDVKTIMVERPSWWKDEWAGKVKAVVNVVQASHEELDNKIRDSMKELNDKNDKLDDKVKGLDSKVEAIGAKLDDIMSVGS